MYKSVVVGLVLVVLPLVSFASFDTDLHRGDTGPAVTELQQFLKEQKLFGEEPTGLFYDLTLNAVRAFQVREGITPAQGYWGAKSRERARALADLGGRVLGATTDTITSLMSAVEQLRTQIASLVPQTQVAQVVGGRTLYVNNSVACSDATTYANNSASSPWCTIGRAAWGSTNRAAANASQAAQAGDTVLISAGTYTTTSNVTACGGVRWEVALNPANSGTALNPITFRGVGNVNIYLGAGYAGPTIGANSRNYIVWDNVRIDEQTAQGVSCPDTGPVVFFMSNGSKIINSYIRGTNRSWGDNYSAIRTEYVTGLQIANNEIRDVSGNMGENNAAWLLYDTADSVFENNYVYNCTTGIYVKGDHAAAPVQQNITIRNNWFENNTDFGIFLLAGANTRIYQNVIKGSFYGIRHFPSSSANSVIANNVLIPDAGNPGGGYSPFVQAPTNLRLFNNIFFGPWSEAVNHGDLGSVAGHTYEHNVYYGYDAFGSVTAQIPFTTWQSTYSQDTVTPAGLNQNPNFVSTSYPGGYKLQSGSPALARGIDILDLDNDGSTTDTIPAGAYITGNENIGRTSGGTPPPPADTTAPTTPGTPTASSITSSSLTLSWTPSTDAVGVTGYRVERCTGSSCTNYTQVGTPSGTTYSDTGLTAATTYRYRVRATDAAGNLSSYSGVVSGTTQSGGDTTAPTVSLSAPVSGATVSGSAVSVSANASDNVGVAGVQFRLDGTNLGTEDTTSPYSITWNTTTATNGSHTLTATARDSAGNTTTSAEITVTVSNTTPDTTPPTTPTNLGVTSIFSTGLNLSWTASTDAVGVTDYRVERCTGSSCTNYTQVGTPSGTTYSDTGLTAATTYRYRVRATDAAGNLSSYSGVVSGTTLGAPQSLTYNPTHFVSPNGTATWAQATSRSTPASAATAFASAVAGNIVEFAPGVYSGVGRNTSDGRVYAFGFANAGTSDNPIIFYAQYPANTTTNTALRSKFRDTAQPADPNEAVMPVLIMNNHTTLDGFWFDDSDGGKPSSRGTVYSGYGTTGLTFKRLRFDRRPASIYYESTNPRQNDNFNSIHFHGPSNVTVTDSVFSGGAAAGPDAYSGAGPNRNWAFITTYGTYNYLIENNIFENGENGIYQKGSGGGGAGTGPDGIRGNYGTIRYNRFVQMQRTVSLGEQEDIGIPTRVYQNLFYWTGPQYGTQFGMEFDNGVGPRNINNQFYNNTLVIPAGTSGGGILSENGNNHTNSMVRNNIVATFQNNNQVLVNWWEQSSPTMMQEFDYNWYYNNGATPSFAVNSAIQTGIAAWRAANGNDRSGDGIDSHSQVGNPMFVDAANYDFRLQSNSPARTASNVGGPVGAYITGNETIGLSSGGTAEPPPPPPPTDTTPPTVSLTAPTNGTTVSGTAVTVSANASDNTGVIGVQFRLDGANLGAEDTIAPYAVSWNTTGSTNGSHTLTAVARDAAGNQTTSGSVTVTISNATPDTTPPTVSNVNVGSISANSATISWTTDEVSDTQVEYGQTTTYGQSTTRNTSMVLSHSATLTALSPGTTYNYRVLSRDSAGNVGMSLNRTFTTSPAPDTTAPSAITTLQAGTPAGTSVTFSWSAPTDLPGGGAAAAYDIRFVPATTFSLTDWTNATQATGEPTPTTPGTTQTYALAGLSSGTTYTAAIRSTDTAGNISTLSNAVTFTTTAPSTSGGGGGGGGSSKSRSTIAPPSNVLALGAPNQIVLTWTNPTSAQYARTVLVRKPGAKPRSIRDGITVYEGTGTEYTDMNGLERSRTYYYAFYALDTNLKPSKAVYASARLNDETAADVLGVLSTLRKTRESASATMNRILTTISLARDLELGARGTDVTSLQTFLQSLGYFPKTETPTGFFGPLTQSAVVKYQAANAITPALGYVGPKTRAKMSGATYTPPAIGVPVATYPLPTSTVTPKPAVTTTTTRTLMVGMQGDDVKRLHSALKAKGYISSSMTSDGTFTTSLEATVKRFQCTELSICDGSPETTGWGAVGPKTRATLGI